MTRRARACYACEVVTYKANGIAGSIRLPLSAERSGGGWAKCVRIVPVVARGGSVRREEPAPNSVCMPQTWVREWGVEVVWWRGQHGSRG